VRLAGLDIGVHRSTGARVGRLTRQGSSHLRWALYEAAEAATRPTSPEHADCLALRECGLSHTPGHHDHRPQARPPRLE
jgi:transposase